MAVEVKFTLNGSVLFTRRHEEKVLAQLAEKYKLDGGEPSEWAMRLTEFYLDSEGIDPKHEGVIGITYV